MWSTGLESVLTTHRILTEIRNSDWNLDLVLVKSGSRLGSWTHVCMHI